jgi:hypothetical protein
LQAATDAVAEHNGLSLVAALEWDIPPFFRGILGGMTVA